MMLSGLALCHTQLILQRCRAAILSKARWEENSRCRSAHINKLNSIKCYSDVQEASLSK
jgi:hypothetical protein